MPHRVVALFVLLALAAAPLAKAQEVDLLVAPHDAPQYRLSNFRVEDGRFGRPVLTFDYERTREGKGRVQLAGRSADGPLRITFAPDVSRARGEVALEKSMSASRGGGYDYEFYFVQPARWAGRFYGNCLVSNSVSIGNPGRSPSPRSWTPEEQAAYEKNKLANKTPDSAPSGYELLNRGDPLVPGMPVKASRYAEWVDAEVLTEAPKDQVTIRYDGDDRGTTIKRDGWLAVKPEVLSQARQRPDSFRPSMRVLPGGSFPLPRDAVAIDDDLELPRGAPLLLGRGSRWEKVYVLDDMGPEVRVRYSDTPGRFDFTHNRTALAIREETLAQLRHGGAEESFADNLVDDEVYEEDEIVLGGDDEEGFGARGGEKRHIFDKSYPIKAALPRRTQVVPDDLEIPEGTPVAYNWARRWKAATVVGDRGKKLLVTEDDSASHFVYRIDRRQLIIQDKTLRKLQRAGGVKAADLARTLRTWTDASGQHKVEARFVRRSEGKVTIRTDAGREITLTIDKLCDEDQELLEGIKPAAPVENPFDS